MDLRETRNDGEDGEGCRARSNAGNAGLCERVAEDGLHSGSGHGECAADECCHENAGQPDLGDERFGCSAVAAHECDKSVDRVGRGSEDRPDADGDQHGGEE